MRKINLPYRAVILPHPLTIAQCLFNATRLPHHRAEQSGQPIATLNQPTTTTMRSSNNVTQQPAQRSQFDIYTLFQDRQQVPDIENQRSAQSSRSAQQVQVVASRQSALIYVRERPIRPQTPPVVVPQPPPWQPSPANSDSELPPPAKVLCWFLALAIMIGVGAAAV